MLLQFFQFSVLALTASASLPPSHSSSKLSYTCINMSIILLLCPSCLPMFSFSSGSLLCAHRLYAISMQIRNKMDQILCKKKKKKVLDAESGAQVISTLLIYQMEKQTIYHAANGCLCVDGCQLSCRGNSCKSLSIIGQTLSPISLKHICKSRYSYTVIHTRTSAGMDDFPA